MGDICSNAGSNKYQRKGIKLILTNLPILLYFILVLDTMCITLDSQRLVSATRRTQEEKLEHGHLLVSFVTSSKLIKFNNSHLKQNSYILIICFSYTYTNKNDNNTKHVTKPLTICNSK